jgi:hypothetical protein
VSSVTKIWPYVVVVVDAEGRTHDYLFKARSRRHAEREARECVAQSEWATSLVRITPMVDYTRRRRRMLAVAAFAISGISMTWAMFIGLSLQGAF